MLGAHRHAHDAPGDNGWSRGRAKPRPRYPSNATAGLNPI
jgi:hypothetical protein